MTKWIVKLAKLLPKKTMAKLVVEFLDDIAEDTKNKLDDKAVTAIKIILNTAFGEELFQIKDEDLEDSDEDD